MAYFFLREVVDMAVLSRSLAPAASIVTGLLAVTWSASALTGTVVDLSLPLEYAGGHNESPGAIQFKDSLSTTPAVRSAIVLEDGKIVASYFRDDVEPEDTGPVFSTTKSWISLLVGILVDDGLLDLDDALGDVFPDEDGTIWPEGDHSFERDVTIGDMLSMTSGLVDPGNLWEDMDPDTMGGGDLTDSLAFPDIGVKGEFSYLTVSNILSYVIKERSGMTPLELATDRVFPGMGIEAGDFKWEVNGDGMQQSYTGLHLTPFDMAKFGQLYLQHGLTSADNRVVSEKWVLQSQEFKTDAEVGMTYGHLFWLLNGGAWNMPYLGSIYCAMGLGGQTVCVREDLKRVVVQMTDLTEDTATSPTVPFAATFAGMNEITSFDVEEGDEQSQKNGGETSAAGSFHSFATASVLVGAFVQVLLF